jgi:2-polyprenyl-6-methoxyphenol hydroxylase-like FAD-dependent oxidoreductase
MRVGSANGTAPAQFDLVVGADGMMSHTRHLLFSCGPTNNEYIHRLEQYAVLFTMP